MVADLQALGRTKDTKGNGTMRRNEMPYSLHALLIRLVSLWVIVVWLEVEGAGVVSNTSKQHCKSTKPPVVAQGLIRLAHGAVVPYSNHGRVDVSVRAAVVL